MIGLPRPDANGGKGDVCLNARSWLNNHQNERSSFSSGVTLAGLRSLPRHYEKSGLESIKAFAGNDISQARLYPEDEVYELEPDLSVQHYEVIEHQFSLEFRG